MFFLRSWYVRKILKQYGSKLDLRDRWRLLDAGSGFGQYDRFILKQFSNVEVKSVDVKTDYLNDSRQYFIDEVQAGRICFEEMDLLDLDFDRDFSFAICIDVLEHIEEDEQVMENVYRALRPGGYFLMHSPSIYSEEDAGGDETFVDEHARIGYSKKDIQQKLEGTGLQPVEVAYTYGSKGHLAWELLVKHPMLWMNKIKLWALPIMAIYYIFTLPVGLILMKLDMRDDNEKGTGVYALAQKRKE